MPSSLARGGTLLGSVAVPLLACACMGTLGTSPGLQRDIDGLQVSVDRLRQENVEIRARLADTDATTPAMDVEADLFVLRDRIGALEAQMRAVASALDGDDAMVDSLAHDLERLRRHQEDMARRLGARASSAAAPAAADHLMARSPDGTSGNAPAERTPGGRSIPLEDDPAGVFQQAYADYTRGDYDLAILGLTRVLDDRPEGVLADDAAYYLGEIARAQGRQDDALTWYGQVIENHPGGDKAPAATLKKGLLLIDTNRIGEGVVQLDHLVQTHPESDEARLARNKLRALGVGR